MVELRLPLLSEGGHAFLLVLGGEQRVEHAPFKQHALGKAGLKRGVHRFLGHHRHRLGFGRNHLGGLQRLLDDVRAGDNAKFGQPEINLGVLPGMGGSQRLTRAVGKSKAMDMILTGRFMDAEEAERAGLVSRVVPAADVVEEALKAAEVIASKSKPVAMVAKEAVNAAFETGLAQGVLFERRVFHSLFATEDQKEGMAAFTEKRQPEFNHR